MQAYKDKTRKGFEGIKGAEFKLLNTQLTLWLAGVTLSLFRSKVEEEFDIVLRTENSGGRGWVGGGWEAAMVLLPQALSTAFRVTLLAVLTSPGLLFHSS